MFSAVRDEDRHHPQQDEQDDHDEYHHETETPAEGSQRIPRQLVEIESPVAGTADDRATDEAVEREIPLESELAGIPRTVGARRANSAKSIDQLSLFALHSRRSDDRPDTP